MPDLSGIITQETQDGRLIVRFLVSAMNGDLLEFQPCHRLDAARLLVKLGFEQAQGIINSAAAQRAAKRNSQRESRSANNRIRSELAQIALEETDNGRTTVRFLVQVMQGELDDFKPCHRLSAAKELLHRGFDYTPKTKTSKMKPKQNLRPTRSKKSAAVAVKKPSSSACTDPHTTGCLHIPARAKTGCTTARAMC